MLSFCLRGFFFFFFFSSTTKVKKSSGGRGTVIFIFISLVGYALGSLLVPADAYGETQFLDFFLISKWLVLVFFCCSKFLLAGASVNSRPLDRPLPANCISLLITGPSRSSSPHTYRYLSATMRA